MCNRLTVFACVLVVACSLFIVREPSLAQASTASGARLYESRSSIRLTLQASRQKYHAGEPIEILGYLENRGDTPYYVGGTLVSFWGTTELHEMRLRIFDASNREVMIGGGGGSWIWKPNTTVAEKIAQAYTQLGPNTIWGVKETLPVRLRAGRYRLTATYREIEALSWTEADRKALAIPVWTQPLRSNTVTIIVSP